MISKWNRLRFRTKIGLQLVFVIIVGLLFISILSDLTYLDALIAVGVLGVFNVSLVFYALSPLDRLAKKATDIVDNPLSQWVYTGRHDDLGKIELALLMAESEVDHIDNPAQGLDEHILK